MSQENTESIGRSDRAPAVLSVRRIRDPLLLQSVAFAMHRVRDQAAT